MVGTGTVIFGKGVAGICAVIVISGKQSIFGQVAFGFNFSNVFNAVGCVSRFKNSGDHIVGISHVAVEIISVHATGRADGQKTASSLFFQLFYVDLRGQFSSIQAKCPAPIEPDRADEFPNESGLIAVLMLVAAVSIRNIPVSKSDPAGILLRRTCAILPDCVQFGGQIADRVDAQLLGNSPADLELNPGHMLRHMTKLIKPEPLKEIPFDLIMPQLTGLVIAAEHEISFSQRDIARIVFLINLSYPLHFGNPAAVIDQISFGEINTEQIRSDMELHNVLLADFAAFLLEQGGETVENFHPARQPAGHGAYFYAAIRKKGVRFVIGKQQGDVT